MHSSRARATAAMPPVRLAVVDLRLNIEHRVTLWPEVHSVEMSRVSGKLNV